MSETPHSWPLGLADVTLPEPFVVCQAAAFVDRMLLLEYCTPSAMPTLAAGWPARDALPTTDPEDC